MSFRKALSLFAAALAFAGAAFAQQPGGAPFAAVNPPQPTESGGKVEVLEFFWYGCPHCYSIEHQVSAWVKKQGPDVVFKRVPAFSNDVWGRGAALYYTLEAMGKLEEMHGKVFDAWHRDRVNFNNPKARDEWFSKNGIDPAKYAEVEKSFTVVTKMNRARQLTSAYKVDGVPRFFVQGKWWTAAELTGSNERIFVVLDQLVGMARKEIGAPAAAPAPAKK